MTPDFGPEPEPLATPGGDALSTVPAGNESRYTDAIGEAICDRLRAGESLAAICRDPEMPAPATVHKWAALRPAFAQAKADAQMAALRGRRDAAGRKLRKTLSRLAGDGRGPARAPVPYSDAVAEVICRRIAHGEALIDICRDADMPSHVTVHAWIRRYRVFDYMIRLAREHHAHVNAELVVKIAAAATPGAIAVARLQIQALRWQAARLAPHAYADKAPIPGSHVIDGIREEGGKGYYSGRYPSLVAKALGEGDWD